MLDLQTIIQGSLVSERAYARAEKGVYSLKVHPDATKDDIKKVLKLLFDVDVVRVNTSILRGRVMRRVRAKKKPPIYVKKSNVKKAFVWLKSGQTLPVAVAAAPEGSQVPAVAEA